MNCAKAQSLMLDHLYGDLRPRREKALLRHLRECSICSDEFETYKATAASFANLDTEEPPPGLTSRLVAMAEEDIERRKSTRTLPSGWNWKPVFASVAVAALAVFIVVRYVPTGSRSESQKLALRSASEMTQEVSMPREAPQLAEGAPKSEISVASENKSISLDRKDATELKRKAQNALEKRSLGGDTVADKIVSAEAPMTRGQVREEADADEAQATGRRARAQAPAPEKELHALGYTDSSVQPSKKRDSEDFYKSTSGGEEGTTSPAESLATTMPATPKYATVNANATVEEAEPAVGAPEPESMPSVSGEMKTEAPHVTEGSATASPATPKYSAVAGSLAAEKAEPPAAGAPEPESMLPKPAEMQEEDRTSVGGSIATSDLSKLDHDVAQEEQMREKGLFDSREFNEAVMESEKAPGRKLDRQRTADYMYNLGKTYQQEGECEKALAIYETIPKEHPDFGKLADVYISMGECYLKNKEFENAKYSFRLAREHNARIGATLTYEYGYSVAENFLRREECDDAQALFDAIPREGSETLSESPPDVQKGYIDALAAVHFAMSKCYAERGDFDDAISVLGFMQSIFPERHELIMQKINEITAMQEAAQKANEQPSDTAAEPSDEEAE